MNELYYTPKIEEFHVGFEYEISIMKATVGYKEPVSTWEKGIYGVDSLGYNMLVGEALHRSRQTLDILQSISDKQLIRVKYLDQQDIEELGWNTLRSNINWVRATKNSTEIIFEKNIEVPIIQIFKNMNCVFTGTIKNKAELKKLMQQLQIN